MQSALGVQCHAVQRPLSAPQRDQVASPHCFDRTHSQSALSLRSRRSAVPAQTRQTRRSTAINCSSTPEALAKHAAEQSDKIPENEQGHAVLHDFCMGIPYGTILIAAGVVSLFFGAGQQGVGSAISGLVVLLASLFSLVQWKQGRPGSSIRARLTTSFSAGVTLKLAWDSWILQQSGIAAVPNAVTAGLSLAMFTFLAYNVIAGGNPPKKADLDDTQPAKSAAAA